MSSIFCRITTVQSLSLTSDDANVPGQCHISSIEDGSAAHYAGLQLSDRIVEVDGVGVRLENHGQVVTRISQAGLQLSLLVTDRVCEVYHETRGIIVTGDLPHVVSRKIFDEQTIKYLHVSG